MIWLFLQKQILETKVRLLTIETLERQLVQAGIKDKVRTAEMEIDKEKEQIKSSMNKEAQDVGAKAILAKEEIKLEKNYQMKNIKQDIDSARAQVDLEKKEFESEQRIEKKELQSKKKTD